LRAVRSSRERPPPQARTHVLPGRGGSTHDARRMATPTGTRLLDRDLVVELPKSDLHVHLDGSLRLPTLLELARERKVKLPSSSSDGLLETVFKRAYRNLPEYLRGFEFTVACLQDAEALERAAYELCWDCRKENVFYVEMRFAPQLHVRRDFEIRSVLAAVARGLERARREINRSPAAVKGSVPAFEAGIIVCAMRYFLPAFSEHYAAYFDALRTAPRESIYSLASLELVRSAVNAVEEDGLPVVGIDLAGQERGFPAKGHQAAYQLALDHFLGKTVHAGEDYGPESIFQAITDCHADRIGHGTWLFSGRRIRDPSITDRKKYVENLVRYVGDRRITLEVCLTSNQQTIPELRGDLRKHPFRQMRRARLSVTLCTDNRLVSRTSMTDEVCKAVETFRLNPRELKDVLIYGFKRSFFPGSYPAKRAYVRDVLNHMERIFATRGIDLRAYQG
jgi:adenosine deaminase